MRESGAEQSLPFEEIIYEVEESTFTVELYGSILKYC